MMSRSWIAINSGRWAFMPCHRVIGSNGALTGFGGGIERKKYLLAMETNEPATVALW